MAAPLTVDEFVQLVRKSELIEAGRLDAFLQQPRAGGLPEEPRDLADLFVGGGLLTRFQSEQLLQGKWRGFTIGKYKVLERLGFGGNGTVYLCEHLVVKRRVAVKVLPTSKAESPAALGRFYREARAAGVLDHPNLVKSHDIDEDNGLHFLIMDYVDGSSLQEIVSSNGPLSVERAAHYVAQAALGLEHAFRSGLVHRDIKPANILLDRTGTVKVLDMGLARFFGDESDPLTMKYDDKHVLGTADYVSPEQALNSHDVDTRADIYSLGCTFYFLLTGRPPFPEGKAARKLIAHQVKEPTPVRELRPEVPPEMAAVVVRMMKKKPEERYQTPGEVAEALAAWTVTPLPPPPESEMPQLCPAARGTAPTDFPETGPLTPNRANRPAGLRAHAAPTTSMAPGSWSSGGAAVAVRTPQRALNMAEVATPRMLASDVITDTQQPRVEGTPAAAPAVAPSAALAAAPAPAPRPAARQRHVLHPDVKAIRLFALLLIGSAVGVGFRWTLARLKKPRAATAVPAATRIVSRSGQPGTYATIREAVRQAKSGERVVVKADVWEESLRLTAEDTAGKEVRIEGQASGNRPVLWRSAPGGPEGQPLLQLSGSAGLSLANFTLDGQDRVPALVALSGPCAGLTLEDLRLTGFGQHAVAFYNCSGAEGKPVTLRRLRAAPARSAASALLLEARAVEVNRHVLVTECRLEGPYQAAVIVSGPAADVELRHNRFFNAADGVLYRKTTPAAPLGLTVAGNTFCQIEKAGLHFEATPPAPSAVTVTGNLFARTGTLARVDDFSPEPRQTAACWIWSAEKQPAPGDRYFRKKFVVSGAAVTEATLDVAGDSGFTVWLNGERVGHGEFQFVTRVGSGDFHTATRRVHAFDVARYLRPGTNVLAVEGSNKMGAAGVLARLTYRCPGEAPVTVVSDESWKVARSVPEGWRQPGLNDRRWPAAAELARYGEGEPGWRDLVWDSAVKEHFGDRAARLFPDPSGNFRDWASREGYPSLKAMAHHFDLPTDPADDATFLRYPRTSPLNLAGAPGVPPAGR